MARVAGKSETNWPRLRHALLVAGALPPLITGTVAALLGFPNQWNDFRQGFLDTFIDYAIPINLSAGCQQIFFWPLSFGVILALTYIKPRWIFWLISMPYLAGYVAWGLAESGPYNQVFPLTNVGLILAAALFWLVYLRRKPAAVLSE